MKRGCEVAPDDTEADEAFLRQAQPDLHGPAHVGEFLRNSRPSTFGHVGASLRDAESEFRRNSPTWEQARSLALLDLLPEREDESEFDAWTANSESSEDADREAAFAGWGEEFFPTVLERA
ncbi:MAG: hypothetical protein WD851_05365 [Pirellulales bacterium]